MILNFIAASSGTKLCKNLITGESYPNVVDVTSYSHESNDLQRTAEILKMHAEAGNALLTGKLTKRLENESRAGHCVAEPVEFMFLDIDADDLNYESRERLIEHLFDGPVKFIFQHSSGSKDDASLRGHYLIKLEKPVTPDRLKLYLKHLNFHILRKELKLSKSKIALKWPLDIVVNDPGRIIFIAPPVMDGADPVKSRIVIHDYGAEGIHIPDAIPLVDVQAEINKLRENETLPKKEAPKNQIGEIDPNEVKITGIKEGKDFIYLNLNGGDSWGYYFNPKNPDIVSNFKEEPCFRLKDLDPELHAKYKEPAPVDDPNLKLIDGKLVVRKPAVFRDPESDQYWQVLYDPNTNEIHGAYSTNTKSRLIDFMLTNGGAKPSLVHDGEVVFDPQSSVSWDPINRHLNLFKATELMNIQETTDKVPQYVDKLIKHLMVDAECYNHFMNWLAYIYQKRDRTGTAWLLHGMTGTGKGTLYSRILKPIFGRNASTCRSENLMENFNSQIQTSLVMFVDEFDINDINDGSKSFNKLKNYITEEEITIRKMRRDQFQSSNFCNFLFSSNQRVPIKIDETERRLNIPPRQDQSLEGLPEWRELLDDELIEFCKYLRGYQVNMAKVRRPIMNDARAQMIINSRTSHEEFFIAVNQGDIDFFLDYVGGSGGDIMLQTQYETVVSRWQSEMKQGPVTVVREDLLTCYRFIVEPTKVVTPIKFGAICRNNNVDFVTKRVDSNPRLYVKAVNFKVLEAENKPKYKDNVIRI